mmetsp:Transcript_8082/g.12451  ORF Transcript_8082/g.12451 Transcript_8082/m.12451 type:complete len:117 (-) Transcript_8082:614-964(-)
MNSKESMPTMDELATYTRVQQKISQMKSKDLAAMSSSVGNQSSIMGVNGPFQYLTGDSTSTMDRKRPGDGEYLSSGMKHTLSKPNEPLSIYTFASEPKNLLLPPPTDDVDKKMDEP